MKSTMVETKAVNCIFLLSSSFSNSKDVLSLSFAARSCCSLLKRLKVRKHNKVYFQIHCVYVYMSDCISLYSATDSSEMSCFNCK